MSASPEAAPAAADVEAPAATSAPVPAIEAEVSSRHGIEMSNT